MAAKGGVQGHCGLEAGGGVCCCVVGASLDSPPGEDGEPVTTTPSSPLLVVLQGEPGSVMSLPPLLDEDRPLLVLLQSPHDTATPLES